MKAIAAEQYGQPEDVLRLTEVAKPTPKDNEVLVKIHAVSLNSADWRLLTADPFLVRLEFGLQKPKRPILGSDIAGTVEAVGRDVKAFKAGDAVFGDLSGCGLGGFAEYVAVPEHVLALKPARLSFEETAALPMGSVTALQALRDKGGLQAGEHVLIHGASGGVGSFSVQIAKALGAHVTAVCSTRHIETVRRLGADQVIDYTREDFAASGQQYDLIVGVNGARSIFDYKRALKPQGRYVMVGGTSKQIFQAMLLGSIVSGGGKKLSGLLQKFNAGDLQTIAAMVEAGKIAPLMDKCYDGLAQIPAALRAFGEGHTSGKIVITVAGAWA
ncbi:MAG: NAD(P)-dependent alcohol dehydrogenase [Pleurocapsa minor GSE-CHR-MK-17-07R]|jgi:NADPH:quinone reductase-like Zn-dependent oxidoreductase|nr:NAD(P)-dependent alcohol dehydrogenase [Pleurocapsa minor GSE-CHR-MK 17-07R]